ncbi:M48 family metalloprotease [Pseudomonas asiatica]|uniref:M48 family metallopeptidase n=1 Tax=Pseudomonas asiatica TaxID=2219225 RepID=UPI002DB5F6CF|nr:M48 family metalloprotease [Pseudomonas asiatica]MEB6588339.1 M48 family metalloprotease [Pseudomonas asiatica]
MTSRDTRILAWRLVLLPLLLWAMALWQGQRADEHRTLLLEDRGQLHVFIAQVEEMQRVRDHRDVQFNGRSVDPYMANSMAVLRLNETERELTFARIGSVLAQWSLPLAAVLTLLGVAALVTLHWAGKAALASRARLVRLFHRVRQLLPLVLAALMVLLTLTAVLEIAYEALWLFALKQTSTGVLKLQLLVGLLMLAMLWPLYRLPGQLKTMLQLFKPEPHDVFGTPLTEQQAPALWARVRSLARRLDALEPDNIVVGCLEGFYVTSAEVLLQPDERRLQGRTLYLPLPLLAVLSRRESDAVIAHELAHFSGEDTAYSMRFAPIYQGVWRSIGVLGEHMEAGFLRGLLTLPAYALAMYSMQRFDHAVSHWSRERELLADAAGARIDGPQAVVDSLVRISALEPLIDEHHRHLCDQPALWPQDLLGSVLTHLAQQPIVLPDAELADELPHPTDTHPPTLQRIQALGMSAEDARHGQALRPVLVDQALARLAEDVPDVPGLSGMLTTALGDFLARQREDIRRELEERAQAVPSESIVREGAPLRGRFLLVVALGCMVAAAWLLLGVDVHGAKPGLITFFRVLAVAIAGTGVMLGVFGWRFIKRAATPALVLTRDTVRFANAPEPIALHCFDQYQVKVSPGLAVVLQLAEDAPLPMFHKRRFWEPDAKFDARTRQVTLALGRWSVDGKALNGGQLALLIGRYLEGGHARQALQALDGGPSGEAL